MPKIKKKIIQLKLQIVTGNPFNTDLCEALTQVVLNSTFSSTVFNGEVIECKIILDEEVPKPKSNQERKYQNV